MYWLVFPLAALLWAPVWLDSYLMGEGGSIIAPTYAAGEGGGGIPPHYSAGEGGGGIPPH